MDIKELEALYDALGNQDKIVAYILNINTAFGNLGDIFYVKEDHHHGRHICLAIKGVDLDIEPDAKGMLSVSEIIDDVVFTPIFKWQLANGKVPNKLMVHSIYHPDFNTYLN